VPPYTESAQVLFHAGKGQDGYFTFEDILKQAEQAIVILKKYYPHENHVLVFNNVMTHMKHAADPLSARKMPKFPTKPGAKPFGVDIPVVDEAGKQVYGPSGKVLRQRIQMSGGRLADGTPQPLATRP